MRQKLREIKCRDDRGNEVTVIEWDFGHPSSKNAKCREYRLDDDSPVTALGGAFEHFYSGKIYRPS